MKLATLIAIVAFFVPSYTLALDSITANAQQPSEQNIALAEQDAGFGYLCIQSGSSDSFICQQKGNAVEVVINRPPLGCEQQQLVQKERDMTVGKAIALINPH